MSASRVRKDLIKSCLLAVYLLTWAITAQPQSLDARSPSPVRSNEIVGRIAARDLGDARLTDHFYAFAGTPGDLLITIETRNLNGDIDVFTAGSLRPVLKFAVYAESSAPVSKSIYLRKREELILRIEARSPNDDDGVYHLRFGGSFEPLPGTSEAVEEATAVAGTATNQPSNRKGKRVSSVGARIEEPSPPAEVAAAPAPEPIPESTPAPPVESPSPEPSKEPKPGSAVETAPKTAEAAPKPVRNPRSRATSRRSRSKPVKVEETAKNPADSVVADSPKPAESAAEEPTKTSESSPPAPARKNAKKGRSMPAESAERSDSTAAAQPEDLSRSKLRIEMLDGTRFERFMNAVRQVTLESGELVVIGIDGTVERIRLARVMKMSIGP